MRVLHRRFKVGMAEETLGGGKAGLVCNDGAHGMAELVKMKVLNSREFTDFMDGIE